MATAFASGQRLTAARLNAATNAGATTAENTSTTLGTTTSTSYTNSLAGAGIFGTSFVAPPSGAVVILFGARSGHSVAAGNTWTSIAVKSGGTVGSGGLQLAASDAYSVSQQSGVANSDASGAISSKLVTGLTPGSTYNVATEHKISTAGTGSFLNRSVQVIPVP